MSGFSESRNCPRCGGKDSLEHSQDKEGIDGLCYECGYEYHIIYAGLTFKELNEQREIAGLPPLTNPRKPLPTWKYN